MKTKRLTRRSALTFSSQKERSSLRKRTYRAFVSRLIDLPLVRQIRFAKKYIT